MSLRWLPNAICVLRIVLVVPFVIALLRREYELALVLVVVAGGSDALDGYLAKTFGWRTRLGSLLDPAADKLLLTSAFLSLTYLGLVPLALAAIVVGRDLLIVFGAAAYQFLFGRLEGQPTLVSKLNTACQLSFVLLTIVHEAFAWPPRIGLLVLGALVVATSVISGLNYVTTWSKRAWRMSHEPG
jgi:cardiolipin synthase